MSRNDRESGSAPWPVARMLAQRYGLVHVEQGSTADLEDQGGFGCRQVVHGCRLSSSHDRSHKKRGIKRYLCTGCLLRACLFLLDLLGF